MDGAISEVQGGLDHQPRVFDGTFCALKWILLFLPGDSKDLASFKKNMAGEGDCTCAKEVLGWTLDTEADTVTLLERKRHGLLTLL